MFMAIWVEFSYTLFQEHKSMTTKREQIRKDIDALETQITNLKIKRTRLLQQYFDETVLDANNKEDPGMKRFGHGH